MKKMVAKRERGKRCENTEEGKMFEVRLSPGLCGAMFKWPFFHIQFWVGGGKTSPTPMGKNKPKSVVLRNTTYLQNHKENADALRHGRSANEMSKM